MVGPYTHHVMIAVPPSALSLARDAESWLRRFLRVALSFYAVSYTHLTLPTILLV